MLYYSGAADYKFTLHFSIKLSHVQWGIPQTRHKGSTFFSRCRCQKWRKEKICRINMLTNGAMFSTFKRTDSHIVRGRPTRKDGVVIYERLFRNVSFCELKRRQNSKRILKNHELAKILLEPEPNQESNDECYQ